MSHVIYCDGSMNPKTRTEAWGSVVDHVGKDLVGNCNNESLFQGLLTRDEKLPVGERKIIVSKFSDVKSQQNNGAELLAMLFALRLTVDNKEIALIKSDSKLVVEYWSKGHVAAKTKRTMDPIKLKFIEECAKLRQCFESRGGRIIHIPGGENLADLGWH